MPTFTFTVENTFRYNGSLEVKKLYMFIPTYQYVALILNIKYILFILCSVSFIVSVVLCDVCYLCVVSYCSTTATGKTQFSV
jgi:hypothetical protein